MLARREPPLEELLVRADPLPDVLLAQLIDSVPPGDAAAVGLQLQADDFGTGLVGLAAVFLQPVGHRQARPGLSRVGLGRVEQGAKFRTVGTGRFQLALLRHDGSSDGAVGEGSA